MRFVKFTTLILTMAFLFLLCSCADGGNDLRIEVSPSDKSLIDLVSRIYDEQQLIEIAKFNGSLNEFNAKFRIECLRENNGTYRASYLGNGSIAVILFDDYGNRLLANIYSTYLLKSDFSGLAKGLLLEEVRRLDPNGEYLFLHTGRNDTPKVSYHYTKDGYLIIIEYDASNTITSMTQEFI